MCNFTLERKKGRQESPLAVRTCFLATRPGSQWRGAFQNSRPFPINSITEERAWSDIRRGVVWCASADWLIVLLAESYDGVSDDSALVWRSHRICSFCPRSLFPISGLVVRSWQNGGGPKTTIQGGARTRHCEMWSSLTVPKYLSKAGFTLGK